jgi:hypothetical protein
MGYANSPFVYANPDAVTQIATGYSTTTFTYDNNGNSHKRRWTARPPRMCMTLPTGSSRWARKARPPRTATMPSGSDDIYLAVEPRSYAEHGQSGEYQRISRRW